MGEVNIGEMVGGSIDRMADRQSNTIKTRDKQTENWI